MTRGSERRANPTGGIPRRERGAGPLAVTGIGPVTSVGVGVDAFWEGLLGGRSGIAEITAFDADDFPIRIAAEVRDFVPEKHLEAARIRWLDRFSQFAVVASRMALDDAGLEIGEPEPHRWGAVVGTGIGGIREFEPQYERMQERGPRGVNPAFIAKSIPNAAAGGVSMELGITGPTECAVTACSSSAHAVARGVDLLDTGAADAMLVGGTEAAITRFALAAFHAIQALSTRNDAPAAASRPFDADRDGFVFGEGATMLVLEPLERARKRGARVYCEVLGYGLSSDAYHAVAPEPEGTGATAAMEAALRSAGVQAEDVSHVSAHATGTPSGDVSEARALERLFGSPGPSVTATKSMTGHMIGAAGSTQLAAAALSVHHRTVPPTINVDQLDPECQLDVVVGEPGTTSGVVLSNSFAFGGHNVCIALGEAR